MAKFDVTRPQLPGSSTWTPLATGQYLMKITAATIGPSHFPNENGEHRDELNLEFTLAEWNDAYARAGYQREQRVFARMAPVYGETKTGGPTKLKKFADPFVEVGQLPQQFDVEDFVGITCQVMVERYTKTKGPSAGNPGNKVLAVMPRDVGSVSGNAAPEPSSNMPPLATASNEPQPPIADAYADMTRDDLVAYAQSLAKTAGGFWGKKDWTKCAVTFLRSQIAEMEAILNPNPAGDEDRVIG